MTDKFQNKYRIASARLQNWDYGSCAAYFITICTANREHYFGEIENATMMHTEIGKIAEQEWIKTIEIRPDMNLSIGDFVVMPNHFHAILFIGENKYNRMDDDGGNNGDWGGCRDARHGFSTTASPTTTTSPTPTTMASTPTPPATPPINTTDNCANHFGPQSKNLASIIRGFKSAVTTYARKNNIPFDWQERYHDHIIRNESEYNRIAHYIQNNIAQWGNDKFNKN
jgi:putative transposase